VIITIYIVIITIYIVIITIYIVIITIYIVIITIYIVIITIYGRITLDLFGGLEQRGALMLGLRFGLSFLDSYPAAS